MPRLERLGHVGIHVNDLNTMKDFYTRVVGLHITEDQINERGMLFLTSNPDWEHHELFLIKGRDVPSGSILVHQISFRVPSLEDVQDYVARFKAEDVKIDQVVTHGFSVSCYFFDPEGNRVEVYWDTKVRGRKAFAKPVNLERSKDEVMSDLKEIVEGVPELAAV
jgi:catechol-2,3-dioxygenase